MKPFKRPRVRGHRRVDKRPKPSPSSTPPASNLRGSDPCETSITAPPESTWLCSLGEEVRVGQVLCRRSAQPHASIISEHDGRVISIAGSVMQMSYCPHDICLGDLCSVCGRAVVKGSSPERGAAGRGDGDVKQIAINIEGGNALRVSRDAAEVKRSNTVKRLFMQKKLALVLDLDHTLVHATDDARAMDFAKAKKADDVYPFKLTVSAKSRGNGKPKVYQHYVKLRPMLRSFLERMHTMYEMYIYTAGTRAYAEQIAKLIDPESRFFQQRIFSRTDFKTLDITREKSLKRIFPVDDSMVLILDDRADVWKSDLRNLMTIKPYHFFIGMHEVNNASGPSFKEAQSKRDKDTEDQSLRHTEGLLTWMHNKFYTSSKGAQGDVQKQLEHKGSDVKVLLKQLRSRIFSMDTRMRIYIGIQRNSQRLIIESIAHRCGARVGQALDMSITHVVAENARSEVAVQAKKMGVWALAPEWLLACEHNWYREQEANYSLFALYDEVARPNQATTGKSPAVASESKATSKQPTQLDDFGYPMKTTVEAVEETSTKKVAEEVFYDDFGYPIENEDKLKQDVQTTPKGADDDDADDDDNELADLANDIEAELGELE